MANWSISHPLLACRQLEAFGYPIEQLVSLLKHEGAGQEDLKVRALPWVNTIHDEYLEVTALFDDLERELGGRKWERVWKAGTFQVTVSSDSGAQCYAMESY